jgi:hypothetical protein
MEKRGRPRSSRRILIEQCCSVLSAALLSRFQCEPSTRYADSVALTTAWPDSGEQFRSIIRITHTVLPTGGRRVWLLCPVCSRRSGRLYLWKETDQQYVCRWCLNAAYDCQYRKNRPDWFRDLLRWQKQRVRRTEPARQASLVECNPTDCPSHIQSLFNLLS